MLLSTFALIGCGPPGYPVSPYKNKSVKELIPLLKDPDKKVRADVAEQIRLKGDKAKEAIPYLIEAFDDQDREVRRFAAEALTHVIRDAYPELIKATKSEKTNVRAMAYFAIGNLDLDATQEYYDMGRPVIMQGLRDPEAAVREQAAYAAKMFGSECILQNMDEVLKIIKEDTDKRTRCNLITGLANIGPKAAAAVPILKEIRHDRDAEVRTIAGGAYRRITGENFEDAQLGPGPAGRGDGVSGGDNHNVPGQPFTPPPGYGKPPSAPDKTPPEKDKPTDTEKKDKSTDTEKPSNR